MAIQFENVLSVYSGKAGKCCCGCSGKHFYREDLRAEGSLRRGYAVDADECSNRMIKRVVNKINSGRWPLMDGDQEPSNIVSIEVDGRWYIAYLRQPESVAKKAVELGLAPDAPG